MASAVVRPVQGIGLEAPAYVPDGLSLHRRPTAPPSTRASAFIRLHNSAAQPAAAGPSSRWSPLHNLGMSQLVNRLQSAATLGGGARPSKHWLRSYSDITMHRLHHLRPTQLSAVIRSMVALDYHPSEDWLSDFDMTCYSHPGPFDALSAVEVLASMTALPDINFAFPQAVYLKVMADPTRFEGYEQLACMLHCLGSHNVPLFDEARFLDVVGERMGQLLTAMSGEEAHRAVTTSLSKRSTLAALLKMDDEMACEAAA